MFTTFNFLSCANNDSNPFCRDHVNHIYDATSKQVKVGAEGEEEKGYVLRFVLLIITNVLRLCIALIHTQKFSLQDFTTKNYLLRNTASLSVFMLFYFSDTEPIILPADGDIDKAIGMLIHYRLF